ncbi:MAG: hypothetical protein SOV85_04675 [Clostridium sp.]|uniref:hypothetical protein n=1 Tax=Clostridium sp. TaxID=1506 RepID=UPI002A74E769|nr:hypothetical protein [Clostridium sp.]MDY2630631.1 hypothetical protein [Clostridium sp.]
MKYEIMFYGGLVITLITLILAIISFLKLNVAEALCDLVGINFKAKRISKSNKEKRKYSNLSRRIKPDITVRKEKKNNIDNNAIVDNKNIKPRYDYNNLDEESTTLLNEENTTLLDEEGTSILEDSTTLLEDESTTMLDEENTTLLEDESTTMLEDENTTLLDEEFTTLLDGEETTIISDDLEETMLIEDDNGFSDEFIKEVDIVLLNSDEII